MCNKSQRRFQCTTNDDNDTEKRTENVIANCLEMLMLTNSSEHRVQVHAHRDRKRNGKVRIVRMRHLLSQRIGIRNRNRSVRKIFSREEQHLAG